MAQSPGPTRAWHPGISGIAGGGRLVNHSLGPVLLWTTRRDVRRFPQGRPLEPQTFVDRTNWRT